MKNTNPYHKYLGPEDHLQHQVITTVKFKYPKIRYHHSPNEGRRSNFEMFRYNYLGSDSGFPDLIFPELLLVMELKVKPNRVTPKQQEWLDYFKSIGWRTEVCWTYDEAMEVIEEQVCVFKNVKA